MIAESFVVEAHLRLEYPDFWFDLNGAPYTIFEPHAMTAASVAEIRLAATRAWRVLQRVAPVMRALPDDELRAIGIPEAALSICRFTGFRRPPDAESAIVRFDFAVTPDGQLKVLEVNAETPFFLWESFEIAGAIARANGLKDPNRLADDHLRFALARALGPLLPYHRVAAAAFNTWREDWFTAQYAARVASQALGRPVDAVPLHTLNVRQGKLRDGRGRIIDALWRFYPIEHMARDPQGPALFDLIERGVVRVVNPPSALLVQNKAALAIIWELFSEGIYFDEAERDIINEHFLPTYLDHPPTRGVRYVRKPVLGREGNSISIVMDDHELYTSSGRDYVKQPMVWQQYVDLPHIGDGSAIFTCYVVGGVASAVAIRVGGPITDGQARFLPIGIA